MEKLNGLEKINLDINFEEEKEIFEEEVNEISLGEVEFIEEECDFSDTLEINIDEVN